MASPSSSNGRRCSHVIPEGPPATPLRAERKFLRTVSRPTENNVGGWNTIISGASPPLVEEACVAHLATCPNSLGCLALLNLLPMLAVPKKVHEHAPDSRLEFLTRLSKSSPLRRRRCRCLAMAACSLQISLAQSNLVHSPFANASNRSTNFAREINPPPGAR